MDRTGWGRLTRAILHGQREMIQTLLEKDDVLIGNPSGPDSDLIRPALHSAIYLGDVDIVKKLLDRGASPNVYNEINETALMLAAKFGKFDIVDLLLSNDQLGNWMNNENFAHLHIACMRNRIDVVKKLVAIGMVDHTDINLSVKSESMRWAGYTPLHFAVEFQSIETVEYLLSLGADITIKNCNQLTALHLADMIRDERIIDMILESHKSVAQNPANPEGLSHFHIACTRNNPTVVECFIKNGVTLDESVHERSLNWSKYTAIDFAIYYDCIDNVRLLLVEGGRDKFPSDGAIDRVGSAHASENVDLVNLILHRDEIVREIATVFKKLPTLHFMCIYNNLETLRNLPPEALSELNKPMWQGSTPLHLAIERGDEAIVKHLLDLGADYGIKNADGRPSLHLAFIRNMKTTVKLILSYLNNVTENHVDNDGLSHLHIACAVDEPKTVERLIQLGADIHYPVKFESELLPGFTPMHFAVMFGSTQVIPILLERGASYSVFDKNGMSAFDIAVFKQGCRFSDETNFKMMKEMLSHSSKAFNDRGFSLLHLLAGDASDQTEVMKEYILNHPNDLNKAVHKLDTLWDGYTPLHFAMKSGHSNNVRLLVEMGADIYKQTSNGDVPFHLILHSFGDSDRLLYISDIPSNPLDFAKMQHNPTASNGYSLFHVACFIGNVEWVKYFLDHGVDPNLRAVIRCHTFYAETPLHTAARGEVDSNFEIIKLLLENGASASAKDGYLITPLHHMIFDEEPKGIDLLVRYGADINSCDTSLDTPLFRTCEDPVELNDNELQEVISMLLKHGADINLSNERGLSPLSFKIFDGSTKFASTIEVIMKHIVRLKVDGLFVSDFNDEVFERLATYCPNKLKQNVDNFKLQCLKERALLSNFRLDDQTSLCDILLKNLDEMSSWSENRVFHQIVTAGDFHQKFRIYGPLLELQWMRGNDRNSLLARAQQILKSLVIIPMPRECLQLILQFLTNDDLRNLIIRQSREVKQKPSILV